MLWAVVAQRLRDCLRICPRPAYNLSLIPHNPSGSAHADPPPFTSPRGLASRRKWRQGTSLYCALSFSPCSSLYSGDPSVSLTADSSPKRGAKALAQRGQRFAARVQHWHADRGNPFLQIKSTKRDGTETPQQKKPREALRLPVGSLIYFIEKNASLPRYSAESNSSSSMRSS